MKQVLATFAAAILAAMPVAGQTRTSEIGMQGGFARAKPAGTGARDHIDLWDMPGHGSPHPSLFVIIPLTSRLSLEPGIAASRSTFSEANELIPSTSTSSIRLTLRGNVALHAGLYGAAGGTVRYVQSDDAHATQVGLLVAIGFRRRLGSRLTARLEAQAIAQRRTDTLAPVNVYAVLLGISRPIARAAPSAAPLGGPPDPRPWRLELGMSGGYVHRHLYGSAFGIAVDVDEVLIAVPGSGSITPPAAYFILPLRGRIALETGFDLRRSQQRGNTLFNGHGSVRLDAAIQGGWYAGAGGNVLYIEQSGSAGFAFAGATIAAGYRFPLTQEFGGRIGVSYTLFKERENFPFAQNIVGLTFGLSMALQ